MNEPTNQSVLIFFPNSFFFDFRKRRRRIGEENLLPSFVLHGKGLHEGNRKKNIPPIPLSKFKLK